jgi:dTDP-4-amino-4,6-dideoxygalactose transaminase
MGNLIDNTYYYFKGRVALYAILGSMGVGKGDEVLLPGFTCVVVPNAIRYVGATPIYVDIDPATYNIDPAKIEGKITERTKVIVAQHTFGIPAEMDAILETVRKYNLYLIEDSCHSLSSRYNGKEVGTFGDAAFFSSQWSKPVTTGLGGWAMVNNPGLAAALGREYHNFAVPSDGESLLLRLQYLVYSKIATPSLFWFLRTAYRSLSMAGMAVGSSSRDELECRRPEGYEKRMTSWQEDLLHRKLAAIDDDASHRRRVVSVYERLLKGMNLATVNLPKTYDPVFLRYPVLVEDKDLVLKEARQARIELGDWFLSPVHPNLGGWDKVNYEEGMCPNAERISRHVINLPTHGKIGEGETERIVRFVGKRR